MKNNFFAKCLKDVENIPIFRGQIYECEYDEFTDDNEILVYISDEKAIMDQFGQDVCDEIKFGFNVLDKLEYRDNSYAYRFESKSNFYTHFLFLKETTKIKLDYKRGEQFILVSKSDFEKSGWNFKKGDKFDCTFYTNLDIKASFNTQEYGICNLSYTSYNLYENLCTEKEYLSLQRKEKLSLLSAESKWNEFLQNKKRKV